MTSGSDNSKRISINACFVRFGSVSSRRNPIEEETALSNPETDMFEMQYVKRIEVC